MANHKRPARIISAALTKRWSGDTVMAICLTIAALIFLLSSLAGSGGASETVTARQPELSASSE